MLFDIIRYNSTVNCQILSNFVDFCQNISTEIDKNRQNLTGIQNCN